MGAPATGAPVVPTQGWQRHKRSGMAHYHSALRKSVPRGALGVGRGAKRQSVRAKRGKIFRAEEVLS